MSKHDFSNDEFESRRNRVRAEMRRQGLDWLILIHPVSIHWLTGSDAKSYQEFQCLFFPAEPNPLHILVRNGERDELEMDALVDRVHGWGGGEPDDPLEFFSRTARDLGLMNARVGLEVPAYYLHPHHYLGLKAILGTALVSEPTHLVHDLKLVKSPAEIAYIRAAAAIADQALCEFKVSLAVGKSELELAGIVYYSMLKAGGGLAASPINLVSGDRSCFSHGPPTRRRLHTGDFGNIEFGATAQRYTATIGRNFCLGQPTQRMQELHDLVIAASAACRAEIRAGVPAIVPHIAACKVISDAGLDRYRVHTTGYGLAPGFPPTWGEPAHMFGGSTYILQAGMVVSIEPPVYVGPEKLGARVIDNVIVTENGSELLSRVSSELIVVDG